MPISAASRSRRHLTAILTLFFLTPTVGLVLPDIAKIAQAHGVSVTTATWVATVPSLTMIPVAILSGIVAGRRIGYRPLVLSATALCAVAGAAPWFVNIDLTGLLLSRALWGLGTGVLLTASNALIVATYPGKAARAKMFARGNLVFSLGSVASLVVGGQLAEVSWRAPFAAHLIAVPALVVLAACLGEPSRTELTTGPARAVRMPAMAFGPIACFTIVVMAVYPVSTLMSVTFEQAALGAPGLVGIVGSVMAVSGLVVAPLFARAYARLDRAVLPLSVVITATGLIVLYGSAQSGDGHLAIFVCGVLVTGSGLVALTIATPVVTSTLVPPEAAVTAQGLVAAALNVGGALSSAYIFLVLPAVGGVNGEVRPLYLASAGVVMAALLTLVGLLNRKRPALARRAAGTSIGPGMSAVDLRGREMAPDGRHGL